MIGAAGPRRSGRLLVTGANGYIGSRLVTTALACGRAVRTLSRSPAGLPQGVPEAERVLGRLPDDIPPGVLDDVDAVVHCAAWVTGAEHEAEAVNVHGTLRLAEAAARSGVRAFLFLSTQSARADTPSAYARTKHAAEEALRTRFADTGMDVVVLRLGLVTGPGERGLYRRLAALVTRAPVVPMVGDGVVQPIHLDDLCHALLRCVEASHTLRGAVLRLGSPQPVPLARFLAALAEARTGRRKPVLRVPMDAATRVVALAERLGLPMPVTSQNLRGASRVEPMDTRADMTRLGVPERSLEEVLREDLAVANDHTREALRLGRYLVGRAPSSTLVARYARAVHTLGLDIVADERRAWRWLERFPRSTRIVDAGLALVKPNGSIRRRLHILLAILEASPEHCDAFLPVAFGARGRLAMVGVALRGGVAGALGLPFVRLLGVKPS